jgi:cytochrome c biogenesis protein CcmG, thiol:disulfide interchange protein DsbE
MSTRAERRRQERDQPTGPKNVWGGRIAGLLAGIAIVAIIVYAFMQRNTQVTGAAVAPNAVPSIGPPAKVGTQAPSFSLPQKGGVFSNATFAGQPYLLEIFATWCPHCQRMTAVLRALRAQFPLSRLGMLSVTGSNIASSSTPTQMVPEDQNDVDTFDAFYNVTWPAVFDKNLSVAQAWGLNGFPTIFIVDAHGRIVYQHSGEVDEKTLAAAAAKAGA